MNPKFGLSSSQNRPRNLSPISTAAPSPNSNPTKSKPNPTLPASSTYTPVAKTRHCDSDEQSRSAIVTKLKKIIKQLSEENKGLKDEIAEQRDMVKQIFNESRLEKYDERRINMLKFQIIQLERQISILTESLGSRSDALMDVENSLSLIADKLRSFKYLDMNSQRSGHRLERGYTMGKSFIAAEVRGQMVPIARSHLMNLVEISESSRIKLFKSVERSTPEGLGKDLLYLNPCLTNTRKQEKPLTLLDINLNRLDYVNLRFVSQLESKLSGLYKELVRVHTQIETAENGHVHLLTGSSAADASASEGERMKTSLLKAGVAIKDCTDDLLALSLLCPSAPWPVLKRPVTKDIPVDRITTALPPLPASKQEEVRHLLKACIATTNHRLHLAQKEKCVLEEELAFHRAVYDTQLKYTHTVFDAVREGCKEFEQSARNLLCAPLKSILEAYSVLETTRSKDALKEILMILKANEPQIKSILEMLEDPEMDNITRSEALSSFGTEFDQHVDSLVASCQRKRDKAVQEKKEVRDSQRKLDAELRQCIEELEAKYERQWVPMKHVQDRDSSGSVIDSSMSANHHHHHSHSHSVVLTDRSVSKDFIHSQLFGGGGDTDRADRIVSLRVGGDGRSRCDNRQRKGGDRIIVHGVDDVDDNDDDNTGVMKLRSFLDDDNDDDGSDNSRKDGKVGGGGGGGMVNASARKGSKAQQTKTKWVSDFASCGNDNDDDDDDDDDDSATMTTKEEINTERQFEYKKKNNRNSNSNSNHSPSLSPPPLPPSSSMKMKNKSTNNKPWKPEKEWVNDFNTDSNLLPLDDQMEGLSLSPVTSGVDSNRVTNALDARLRSSLPPPPPSFSSTSLSLSSSSSRALPPRQEEGKKEIPGASNTSISRRSRTIDTTRSSSNNISSSSSRNISSSSGCVNTRTKTNKAGNSKRSYEVDLRVANNTLKLKRPDHSHSNR